MLQPIIDICHNLLRSYPGAQDSRDYLNSRISPDSQDIFQLGYFPNSQHLSVLTDLIDQNVLQEQDLLYQRAIEDSMAPRTIKTCYFEDYPVVMPYHDPYGNPVALVGRTLLNDQERAIKKIPKYKNSKESPIFKKGNLLFGLYQNKEAIIEQQYVYLVEGQFDLIKASQIGFRNIVALGNNNLTSYQFGVIMRYTSNLFLLLDNDQAGQIGRDRIIKKFGHLANISNFYVPEPYKDIDQYITEEQIKDYTELSFVVKD